MSTNYTDYDLGFIAGMEAALSRSEQLARALHMTDPDVLAFAVNTGEARATADGPMLQERGPHVIAVIERMWDRDELGARTECLARADRLLDLLRPK